MNDAPLSDFGEEAVLESLLQQLPPLPTGMIGAGDDCAVVPRDGQWDTLLKTDVVVESIHFLRATEPQRIGHKALARALSDIAAMGGIPEHALVTLLVHPSRPLGLLKGIYEGMAALARRYGVVVAGGETSALPYDGLAVNVALTGRVERGKAVLRSTGRCGDILCVTGPLGGSFPSGHHLDFEPRLDLARRLMADDLRPSAMMDLSDGLGSDLPRLAQASACGFSISEEDIPCNPGCSVQNAIGDGEDYELLLAISVEKYARARSAGLPLHAIGTLTKERGTLAFHGWSHFVQTR